MVHLYRHDTYLNGSSRVMSSTESSRPYHGHITKICGEYAMKHIRDDVKPTNSLPTKRPMQAALENERTQEIGMSE